jgi:hypothetical protein
MITKDELLRSMLRECDICLHLATKVPPGGTDFRFTPPQRSTLELLRYLSMVGLGVSRSVVAGDWAPYQALAKEAESLAASDFPAAMARQKAALSELFAGLSDADLDRTFTQPWGEKMKVGQAILTLAYASLAAYRLQLFLHCKAAGNASIDTANCWAGRDMEEVKKAAASA